MPKTDHRVSLSDRKIQSLKPAAKGARYQVMDAEVPGFGVRITDAGVRTFIFRTRFPGSKNPNRREIGKYPFMALADAREGSPMAYHGQAGDCPAAEERRQRAAQAAQQVTTFGAVVDVWFKEKVSTERKGERSSVIYASIVPLSGGGRSSTSQNLKSAR
jgi:Arm DNA-binding domain